MTYLWGIIIFGCLIWYSLTCVYITIYGALDIKTMLAHLRQGGRPGDPHD